MIPAEGISQRRAESTERSSLHLVNELSNRRRLTTFFVNEQSPFYGVQVNYVNVGRGNLTFLNRDLVRLDRIPIVAGRVYDSRLEAESDFGPGWKLSVSEMIRHRGDALRYIDASGSVYELQREGTRIVSPHAHLTGISGGRLVSGDIELTISRFTKRFTVIRGDFYLSTVTDDFGNSLYLEYSGTQVKRISSQHGRYIEIARDAAGRITSMHDDAGRTVEYRYDPAGRLYSVLGIGDAQWRYRYDADGGLQGATDPRGIDALTASHGQDGRVNSVRVLYDVTSLSYQGAITTVENGLQQGAVFWHHESGLTNTIQDFSGSTTQVEFNSSLEPVSLSFNGAVVAEFRYGDNGKLQTVLTSIEGRPRGTRFSYDAVGRLEAMVADDQQLARYRYDGAGRVVLVDDAAGPRSYEYFGETGYQLTLGEREFDIETSSLGLMASFSDGHQNVGVSYNELDQVIDLSYVKYGDVYEVAYTYGVSGLRSGGSYLITDGQQGPGTLSLDYDVVGNLTNLSAEAPTGARGSQTYVLGINNQLTRLMNPQRPDLVFEYDGAGRPTRQTLGTNDVSYTYDALGRITAVYEREQKILEWRYGPMDVDAATEGDDHTPWTAVNEPIASAIFGSTESIAYARTRGTPFGPIRFNAAMARFILAAQPIPSADSVTLVSLQRRNVPLSSDHHAYASSAPLGFDKPSNALFLPAEFSSLNCYMCVGRFSGPPASMFINGSSGTPTVLVGSQEQIEVAGSTQCWNDVYIYHAETNEWEYSPEETGVGLITHYFDFGDGSWQYFGGDYNFNKTAYHTHYEAGLYHVLAEMTCGCQPSDVTYAEGDVNVCDPEGDAYDNAFASFTGPRSSLYVDRYNFHEQGNTFSFSTLPGSDVASLQTDVETSHNYWNISKANDCGVTYTISAAATWSGVESRNLIYDTAASLGSNCATQSVTQVSGVDYDLIRVLSSLPGSCGPRAELLAHELGHVLGFGHSSFSPDIMWGTTRVGPRSVEAHHAQVLLARYQVQ